MFRNSVLVVTTNGNICAKITDFSKTKEIELKENEMHEDLREEYFNFGLVNIEILNFN
jgi:hypothetical protein